jgi:hypothetical protein
MEKENITVQNIKVLDRKYGIQNLLKDFTSQQQMLQEPEIIILNTMICLTLENMYYQNIVAMENVDSLMHSETLL